MRTIGQRAADQESMGAGDGNEIDQDLQKTCRQQGSHGQGEQSPAGESLGRLQRKL